MSEPRITFTLRPDATRETELSALAACYRLILNSAKLEAAPRQSRPDDARKDQDAGTYPNCT